MLQTFFYRSIKRTFPERVATMTNFQIALCAILVVSMANPLIAHGSSSTTSASKQIAWWEYIFSPVVSLQNYLNNKVEIIVDLGRESNEEAVAENHKIFQRLTSVAIEIRKELDEKNKEIMSAVGSVLDTEKMAPCKKLYKFWWDMGNYLAEKFIECRKNKEPEVQEVTERLQSSQHIHLDANRYRTMLESCTNTEGFLSGPRAFLCTLNVYVRWFFFSRSNRSEMDSYVETSMDLRKLRDELRTGEACVNTLGEKDFRQSAKTIVQNTRNCVVKHSASAHEQPNV